MIKKETLKLFYVEKRLSVSQIAFKIGCSQNKVTYWLQKYGIQRRSISEAVYIRSNPQGDPFYINHLYRATIGFYMASA